MKYIIMF